MSTNSNFLQVTLPSVGKPKWKRTFHTEDVKPKSISYDSTTLAQSSSGNRRPTSTTAPEQPSSSLLPTSKKNKNKPFIQVIEKPIEYDSKLNPERQEKLSSKRNIVSSCPICNKNEIRYTCPKCMTPFCSVECYKIHDLPPSSFSAKTNTSNRTSSTTNRDGNDINTCTRKPCHGGGVCTETFYRHKVNEICHLDVFDEKNKSQMKDILTRSFYNIDKQKGHDEGEEMTNDANKNTNLSEDELVELATYVLSMEDFHEEVKYDDYKSDLISNSMDIDNLDNIPENLRSKFEQAVQRGELNHLITQWYPYWLPDHDSVSDVDADDDNKGLHNMVNLDERILSIPKLVKSSTKHIELQFNICEVLYVTAYVLRFYNGCSNNKVDVNGSENDLNLDSAYSLYTKSKTLSSNKIYVNLSEVCMECTITNGSLSSKSSNLVGAFNRTIDWKVLLNDVLYICQHKRLVLRVLFDAIDILSTGYQTLKSVKSHRSKRTGDIDMSPKSSKKQWKLAIKKLEYFTSWTDVNWEGIKDFIVHDVKTWMNDWILKDSEKANIRNVTLIGSIASTNNIDRDSKYNRMSCKVDQMSRFKIKPIMEPECIKVLSKNN